MSDRQIVLDTETTGLEVELDHRIVEIGCVELRARRPTGRDFHRFLNPQRTIDAGAQEVHGIDLERLADKPTFAEIADELIDYLRGAELIIHNAPFDVGFLDAEFARAGRRERIAQLCTVTDSLLLARRLHPGQRNGLDALCKRYQVNNSHRELHGALLDARLLAEVWLAMTGGQAALGLDAEGDQRNTPALAQLAAALGVAQDAPLPVRPASAAELAAHRARLLQIQEKAGRCLWTEDLLEGEG